MAILNLNVSNLILIVYLFLSTGKKFSSRLLLAALVQLVREQLFLHHHKSRTRLFHPQLYPLGPHLGGFLVQAAGVAFWGNQNLAPSWSPQELKTVNGAAPLLWKASLALLLYSMKPYSHLMSKPCIWQVSIFCSRLLFLCCSDSKICVSLCFSDLTIAFRNYFTYRCCCCFVFYEKQLALIFPPILCSAFSLLYGLDHPHNAMLVF